MSKPAVVHKPTFLQILASFLAGSLLKLLALTLRIQWNDGSGVMNRGSKAPVIFCVWHNRLLGALFADYRKGRVRSSPLSVLTSASKDGGWLEAIARRFRLGAVRGSSSRRGAAALLEITRHLGSGGDIVITPDGPRGPAYQIAPGMAFLAQRTGVRIVPVEIQISRKWHVGKKWDALWIPKPFAKVTLNFQRPIEVPEAMEIDAAIQQVDAAMGDKAGA